MDRTTLGLLPLVLLACRFDGDTGGPGDSADTDADTDTDTDTDADTDADTDTDTDTDSDTDTDLSWIVEVDRDTTTYGEADIEIVTYGVTVESPTGYRDPDGNDPLFHVIKPVEFATAGPHPVLLWLHGSAQGVDDDEERNARCGADGIATIVADAVEDHHFIAAEAANRDWIWVVPENTWCDLWTGQGADDLVDPSHHGTEHAVTVLDALEHGFDDLQADPDRIYGWGTSIGGAGIVTVSAMDPDRFQAVVVDSGPINPASWYNLPSEAPYLDHIFGGPAYDEDGQPTGNYDAYARADATILVPDAGYRVPMFQIYNTYDILVPERQNAGLASLLEEHYRADGVRYFSHNTDHHAPANSFHVQTGYERPPFSYANRAAFAFLEGAKVVFFEAEDTCPTCQIVAETGTGELEASSAYSQGAAIYAQASDGSGIIFSGALPDRVPRGLPLTFLPVLAASDTTSRPTDGVITFEILDGEDVLASIDLQRGDLAAGAAETHAAYFSQVENTTWVIDTDGDGEADALPDRDLTIQARYHGRGELWLDGFYVLAQP